MLSQFCIRRPIFATVLSIIIVLAGLIALRVLPLSQYPDISPPTVRISTTYDGADAQTLARGRSNRGPALGHHRPALLHDEHPKQRRHVDFLRL